MLLAGDGHFSQVFNSYGCKKIVFFCWIHRFFCLFSFSSLSLSHTHTQPLSISGNLYYFNNSLILTGFSPQINCISPSLEAAGENHNVVLFPKQNPADSSPSGGVSLKVCLPVALPRLFLFKTFSSLSLFSVTLFKLVVL